MQLGKIARLGNPVVHLHVDVGVVVSVPRRVACVRPKSLEIRRQTARTGAGYQQIASVVII